MAEDKDLLKTCLAGLKDRFHPMYLQSKLMRHKNSTYGKTNRKAILLRR